MEGKRISGRKFRTSTTPSLRDGLALRSDGGEGGSPSTYLRNPEKPNEAGSRFGE
jgi:hypothetical protein